MAVTTLVDLVKVTALSTGGGTILLGSAVPGFRGIEALLDGHTYSYSMQPGGNYEFGSGVFSASGSTLTRSVIHSSYGDGPINMPPNTEVIFTALAKDLTSAAAGGALLAINNLSDVADVVQARANLGLTIGTNVQAWSSELDALAAMATTPYGRGFLTLGSAALARAYIGTVIGTDVQAWDADLDAIAALATQTFGRSLLTMVDASAARTALGVARRSVAFQIVGTAPTASELLFSFTPPTGETWTLAGNFTGMTYKKASTGTNPAGVYDMDVKKNGASVGTLSISTGGVVTATTTSGAAVSLVGGTDVFEVFGNATPDAGALGYTFTFEAGAAW